MSFQRDHAILVVAPAAYAVLPATARWLMDSCKRYGIELTLVGCGKAYPNNWHKVRLVAEHLRRRPDYRYVLQIDLKDVVFCATLPEIFYKYIGSGHAILAAAERTCWPIHSHAPRSPETGTSFRYLNSGSIFSTRQAWLDAWEIMQCKHRASHGVPPEIGEQGCHIFYCDQAAWSDLYVHQEADIGLDGRSDLFLPLACIDKRLATNNADLAFDGRRVIVRETGGRPCLIHANADAPMARWGRYVLQPSPAWIWPAIQQLRTRSAAALQDRHSLERLLLALGLGDLSPTTLPPNLLAFTRRGLSIWQWPNQYAGFLTWLAGLPPIRSYLEIGVHAGGTFITTTEYLRRFHPLERSVGVDPWLSPPARDYVARVPWAHFVVGTRQSPALQQILRHTGSMDLTFIDGDHSSAAVRADWEFARNHSRYVAFHDTDSPAMDGVTALWREIRATHRKTYEFHEQYDPRRPVGGIGVVDLAYGQH